MLRRNHESGNVIVMDAWECLLHSSFGIEKAGLYQQQCCQDLYSIGRDVLANELMTNAHLLGKPYTYILDALRCEDSNLLAVLALQSEYVNTYLCRKQQVVQCLMEARDRG